MRRRYPDPHKWGCIQVKSRGFVGKGSTYEVVVSRHKTRIVALQNAHRGEYIKRLKNGVPVGSRLKVTDLPRSEPGPREYPRYKRYFNNRMLFWLRLRGEMHIYEDAKPKTKPLSAKLKKAKGKK